MIITIDGPTASGKSTVARKLAQQLGYLYINSGLLFRAVAYKSTLENVPLDSPDLIKDFSKVLTYTYTPQDGAQVFLNNKDITSFLKTPKIDRRASQVATVVKIREALLEYQRSLAKGQNVIADGRDCGTVVFPQAQHKFFITADLDIRAERWQKDQQQKGNTFSLKESRQRVAQRDAQDTKRTIAPLVIPEGAHVIDTSNMTVQEVVETCLSFLKKDTTGQGE